MVTEKVFEDSIVTGHCLAGRFLSDLDLLCQRDYGNAYFGKKVQCLDMDAVEQSNPGMQNCTMDAATGIADYRNGTASNGRFLLVELRLDYKSTANFDYSNMSRKVSHTKDLLSGSIMDSTFYFVFNDNLWQRAQSDFDRRSRSNKEYRTWKAVSPQSFFNEIKFKQDLPPVPETDIDKLKKDISTHLHQDIYKAFDFTLFWLGKVDVYRVKNNHNEANAILEAVKDAIEGITDNGNTDLRELRTMLLDEIGRKINNKY